MHVDDSNDITRAFRIKKGGELMRREEKRGGGEREREREREREFLTQIKRS